MVWDVAPVQTTFEAHVQETDEFKRQVASTVANLVFLFSTELDFYYNVLMRLWMMVLCDFMMIRKSDPRIRSITFLPVSSEPRIGRVFLCEWNFLPDQTCYSSVEGENGSKCCAGCGFVTE